MTAWEFTLCFAERLNQRLRALRMSRYALADLIGNDRRVVDRWAHGVSMPSAWWIARVAPHLGVTPEWLAFGVEPKKICENPDATILAVYDLRLRTERPAEGCAA